MDLDIKIKDRKFQVSLFDKRDSCTVFVVKMPGRSRYAQFNIFTLYSAMGTESLGNTRASNNTDSFLTAIKLPAAHISKNGAPIENINHITVNFVNKYQVDFKQELLHLTSNIIKMFSSYLFRQTLTSVAIVKYMTLMSLFCK